MAAKAQDGKPGQSREQANAIAGRRVAKAVQVTG